MYFGKYLIDQKLITHDKLIEALVEQEKSQKSFLEVAIELDLIDIKLIPEFINNALEDKSSFQQYLLKTNILTVDKINQINKAKTNSGLALGSILVNLGSIDAEKLNTSLREYLNQKKLPVTKPVEPEISQAALDSLNELNLGSSEIKELEETKRVAEPEISAAALESLRELGLADDDISIESVESIESNQDNIDNGLAFSGLNSDYIDLFSQTYFDELDLHIKSLRSGFDEIILMDIHERITLLLGAATLEDFSFSIKLLKCYQVAIENCIENKKSNIFLNFLPFVSKLKEAIALLWDLRNSILEKSDESKFTENNDLKITFFNNLKQVITIIKG